MTHPLILASVFDWRGPQFLAFYGVIFLIALIWSLQRRGRLLRSLNPPPGTSPTLADPIEIAYLAGGPSRCIEVALVNLIEQNILSWRPGRLLKKGTLTVIADLPSDAHWFERQIYTAALAEKDIGLPLRDLVSVAHRSTAPLEGRLASLGLRPTASELSGKGTSANLPFFVVLIIGAIKLAVGLSRDKPVGFLIASLIITAIVMVIIKSGIKKLTPAGQSLLDQMRAGRDSTPDPGLANVALFGIAGATAYSSMPAITPNMINELKSTGISHTNNSGCSTSSDGGGSDSGCGGGGCGGCGD